MSNWTRIRSAVSAWGARRLGSCAVRLRAAGLVFAAAILASGATPSDARPAAERRSGSGAGGIVEYETSHVIDGRSITASVRVFVVVPNDSDLPQYVAVGVTEVDDATGEELFSGTGTAAPGEFTVGPHFSTARVTGSVTVESGTPGITRVADVDVVWSPLAKSRAIRVIPRRGGQGIAGGERHLGRVRRMTGVGLVRISDPSREGYEFSITSPGLGAAWKTRNSSRAVDPPVEEKDARAAGRSFRATSGYWTGYWTWKWNGTKWLATWTWVWRSSTGSYVTS